MEQGYLAIVLHAHLPYVRHPEYENSLEENWLFEAITETYIPLFLVIDDLLHDGVDFRLTISLSPPLASMLLDPFLQARYLRKLDRSIELAEKEIARTASQPELHALARMYRHLLARVREAYLTRYDRNLVRALRRFQDSGKVEVITTAATHGYLPLLAVNESALRAQIRVGVESYRQMFGRAPAGFWLPECGYASALDAPLRDAGIRYTILETHGLTRSNPRARHGVYSPIYTPAGLAAFGRDPDSSRQVWSSVEGYPGDYDYREFYRDIGYDLPLDYIAPYIHPAGIRIDTGFKYYRITGGEVPKEVYVPEWAERKAEAHAAHFLSERLRQVERLAPLMDRKPIIVAPYDAELFGHWWFEGPSWLDYLIRKVAIEQDCLRLITLSEYLNEYPTNQAASPAHSSWGNKGFSEVWLNPENDWIYPHLHDAAASLEELGRAHPAPSGLVERAMNQAARELLLAQSSDWAFMIGTGAMTNYATRRTKSHLLRLQRLVDEVQTGTIDEAWLARIEKQDNIFPRISTAADFLPGPPAATHEALPPQPAPAAPAPARLHVVMVSPEIVPFAKTGGLADMVGSLALAIERLGHKVTLILPAHRGALSCGVPLEETGIRLSVPFANRNEEGDLLRATIGDDISVYLVRAPRYFDRDQVYGTAHGDYPDNAERFVFFSRAILEAVRHIGPANILHAHDWPTALAIAFLKTQPEVYPEFSALRTVLTVHNAGYQGRFPASVWPLLNLDWGLFNPRHLESYGAVNFLKGGAVWADAITAVSPTNAVEIRSSDQGFGLEGVFTERAAATVGILNGVDYDLWNPAADPYLTHHYSAENLSGKAAAKASLQRLVGLLETPDIPLAAVISRLAWQKGSDLLQAVFDDLLRRDLQFVLLGSGEARYEDFFRAAAARYPGRVAVCIAFDESLAHQIEAAADIFLMPSRYEPAGLNQLYSLKYGAIPVVRATGGLKDSVQDFDPATGQGTGIVFDSFDAGAFLSAVDRALALYHQPETWSILQQNAMAADFSWLRSAKEYLALYQRL